MNSETVVLCYPVSAGDLSQIELAFPGARIICSSQERIGTDVLQATMFCGHAKHQQIDWKTVVQTGNLRWIQSSAAGLDHCLVPEVINSEIVVSGCSGLFANQVSEHALALLLAMIRKLPQFVHAQDIRVFQRRPTDTLHGKTVGIVGFGGNGRRIAAVLKNLAGSLLATDLFPEFDPPEYVVLLPAAQMDRLFQESDIVIVTLPLTPDTKQCIGAGQFAVMKQDSYFVNVARGAVVDQPAMINALEHGPLAYAGLDVLDPEPPQATDRIWTIDNVLITPHVGAQSADRVAVTTRLFCRNAELFFGGATLLNQVDKKLQFPRPEHRIGPTEIGELAAES